MKKILTTFYIILFFVGTVYALPLGIFILGNDFFLIFIGILISGFLSIFFYVKNLKTIHKLIITILLIFSYFPIKYIYTKYKKKEAIKEYKQNMINLGLYNLYYNNGFLLDKYNKYITVNELKKHPNNYYLIDIREKSELYGLNKISYKFHYIRTPELIKNNKKILSTISKPIVITCIDGERGKIISSFLGNLGYNSYYLKGGLNALGINYGYRLNLISPCKIDKGKKIFVGINDNNFKTIDIPYLLLTNNDTEKIIKYFEKNNLLNKNDKTILLCDKNKLLNCGVGRQSLGLLLKNLGFKKICLGGN